MKKVIYVLGWMISCAGFGQTVHTINVAVIDDCTTLSVDDELVDIEFYPNPVEDKFYIKTAFEGQEMTLVSPQGKIVRRKYLVGGENEIEVTDLRSGIYTVRVRASSQRVKTFKLKVGK